MIYEDIIRGKTVQLRAVKSEDAEFILKIRQDKQLSRFLHPVKLTVDQQKKWIKEHQDLNGDYYFLVLDLSETPIGTVGISNIKEDCGEIGRLIMCGNVIQSIETSIIITDFAFDVINLKSIRGYVMAENRQVISMQKKFGYIFENEIKEKDGLNVKYAYLNKELYLPHREKIVGILNKSF